LITLYGHTVTSSALYRALTADDDLALPRLPDDVAELLLSLDAPPRLAAHLRLVHDVANQLTDLVIAQYPGLNVDRTAVLFGAATHDVGKSIHIDELSSPGSAHEQVGYDLLISHGFPPDTARFARTHATWGAADVTREDLLVSVADKIWKGKRVIELEQLLLDRLTEPTDPARWQAFTSLDDALERLSADADRRLAFQTQHAIHRSQ
jgi:HD domain